MISRETPELLIIAPARLKLRAGRLRHDRVAVLRKSFDTMAEAVEARRAAERKYFGAYAPTRSD